jgi:type I restriction enzyme R subunit
VNLDSNEAATRARLIDPQLRHAGWRLEDPSEVRLEIPVDGYDAEPWNGITDYCLYEPSGDVIAVVEAKRFSRDPRDADEQLRHYLTEIGKRQNYLPFGFMANGRSTSFWDLGQANPRPIAGFFTPTDLRRLLFLRVNRKPLNSLPINREIVDRPYQHEAIRRVAEAFAASRRRALLVMATGTGKTRTAMALIELFQRAHQAQNVLFLADRDALVTQALSDGFRTFLPHEPRDRIYTHQIDLTKRLFVATEQTMSLCFQEFSPGFFDLIIFDEAHRSIFQRFTEVIEYFDARMIGLTATPANFIDRDTFRVFHCQTLNGRPVPTFLYEYQQAVREHYLVDFSLYQAHTTFQRKGIRGLDLSDDDRNALIEQGIDPDIIDYAGTDLEVEVSNKDTIRKQWEEIMEVLLKDESGQLPGKTIVFAMTRKHAGRLRDVFEEMYPQHTGLLQVIASGTERVRDGSYGDGLISKFKKNDLPRIAVSVDMLDTGVDIPEVVNLVFLKPVQSHIKLWQMIGRGTRSDSACRHSTWLPTGHKTEFKIIDFWQNDFDKEATATGPGQVPVLVGLFNTRLSVLQTQLPEQSNDISRQAIADLRSAIARIPLEAFPVKRVFGDVEQAWGDEFWRFVGPQMVEFLRLQVGPLLRFVAGVDVAAETFAHKVERLKLETLHGGASIKLSQSVAEDVRLLPPSILQAARLVESVQLATSLRLATATAAQLTRLAQDLAPEMRNRRNRPSAFLTIDLPDFVEARGLISLGAGGQQVYVEEYRRRVEGRVLRLVEGHPAFQAIRAGREPTDEQLIELERTLHRELGGADIDLSAANMLKAYGLRVDSFLGFMRHILSLDAIPDYSEVVQRAFSRYIEDHQFTADQIRFIRSVQEVFLGKKALAEDDLYAPPLTSFGRNAVERYFNPNQVRDLLALADGLAA